MGLFRTGAPLKEKNSIFGQSYIMTNEDLTNGCTGRYQLLEKVSQIISFGLSCRTIALSRFGGESVLYL